MAETNRNVFADSYYSSVESTIYLKATLLRFIDAVKTETRIYSMKHLYERCMYFRGDRAVFVKNSIQREYPCF